MVNHTQTIPAHRVIDELISEYNKNAAAAAYWKDDDREAYRCSATAAASILGILSTLFRQVSDFEFVTTPANVDGKHFSWRKAVKRA